jgi:O-antigen/teichoic acid export membrane protein
MSPLRKLAGQTAVYGVSSIVGRLLNYFLVPFYTRIFSTEQFGIVTEMYAYVAFLVVILTYGMETAFFRFTAKTGLQSRVFSTILLSIISTSTVFIVLSSIFSVQLGTLLGYPNHTEYVIWFAIIVGLDAISSMPMAQLRQNNKARTFLFVSLANVLVNIGLNIFFLVYCRGVYDAHGEESNWLVRTLYSPEIGVGYVFISNLVASIVKIAILAPGMFRIKLVFDRALMSSMLRYATPLMILGLAGIVNETIDRVLLKFLLNLPKDQALAQLGIYGACYKVAIIMSLAIQAFRYAAEPYFFNQQKESDSIQKYAQIMKYFVIMASFIFLGIMLFIDVVMLFVGKEFREGQNVVPILLLAYIFYGIVFNLSFWFKLSDRTTWGAIISIAGATVTVLLNVWLIPIIGYMGSAWATLASYTVMMIISFFLGKKYFPIPYEMGRISLYLILALALFGISLYLQPEEGILRYIIAIGLLAVFAAVVWFSESRKKPLLSQHSQHF